MDHIKRYEKVEMMKEIVISTELSSLLKNREKVNNYLKKAIKYGNNILQIQKNQAILCELNTYIQYHEYKENIMVEYESLHKNRCAEMFINMPMEILEKIMMSKNFDTDTFKCLYYTCKTFKNFIDKNFYQYILFHIFIKNKDSRMQWQVFL